MDQTYYQTVDKMEKASVDKEYMNGWMCGYLRNPKREEQRLTDAYNAGYDDGTNRNTDNMSKWAK
ncbi:MAG: hypothetical protein OEY67_03290 [Gammaproteobacteria bacterium]|nr:hypothetical protein [Gammaproteobacteria bacterium]